jgi:hypothetical protein
MRSHGVADFPDPSSGGEISKTEVVAVRQEDPQQFDSAEGSCGHVLPSGGGNGETPAEIAQDWTQDRQFARCMRRHGVPNWPTPPTAPQPTTGPCSASRPSAWAGTRRSSGPKAQQCASSLHMIGLPVAG